MIEKFKDATVRKTGVIYESMFETVKKRYSRNPQAAGELAISFLEFVLTGEISSDDFSIEEIIDGYRATVEKNKQHYDAKLAGTRDKYARLLEMKRAGMKQVEIARELGVQPPAVSKMFAQIREKFPELLETQEISGNVSKVSEMDANEEIVSKMSEISGKSGNVSKKMESISKVSNSAQLKLETGNVSKVSKVSTDNDYDNDNEYDNESGKSSISPPEASPRKTMFEF